MNRQQKAELKRRIAAMPKCPECGGFAIPSFTEAGAFVCKEHGRFTPKAPQ